MGTALFTLVNLEESGPLTTDDRPGLCALCLCVEWPPPHYHRVSVCWVTPLPIFMPPLHKENDLLCELSVISLSLSLSLSVQIWRHQHERLVLEMKLWPVSLVLSVLLVVITSSGDITKFPDPHSHSHHLNALSGKDLQQALWLSCSNDIYSGTINGSFVSDIEPVNYRQRRQTRGKKNNRNRNNNRNNRKASGAGSRTCLRKTGMDWRSYQSATVISK